MNKHPIRYALLFVIKAIATLTVSVITRSLSWAARADSYDFRPGCFKVEDGFVGYGSFDDREEDRRIYGNLFMRRGNLPFRIIEASKKLEAAVKSKLVLLAHADIVSAAKKRAGLSNAPIRY